MRIVSLFLILGLPGIATSADAESLFALRVLPTLKARCYACHGENADKIKGGLDLTSRQALLTGGDSGEPGVLERMAKKSPIYRAVLRTDEHFNAMPPKENDKLAKAELEALADWIDGGAPWPSDERIAAIVKAAKPAGVKVATSGGLSSDWTNREYKPDDLWAYQPLKKPAIPATTGNPVDAFLAGKMKSLGVPPSPRADRRTLIRRVTFDLTGLPPSVKEIDDFLNDKTDDATAFAKVVDRLLASPHYGEQMARHWLDIARYADSAGIANDFERGSAWRYRDYVVRSFNADKPYDRFVKEQIAGDEIDAKNPEMIVAAGFLRMGAWELTGMEVAKIARQRFLDDVTDTVGQVFLGHMLQCARCHDHKFDPVPTRDYYRIQAAFATTQLAERSAEFLAAEIRSGFEEKKYLDARKSHFESELKRIAALEKVGRAAWEKANPDAKGRKPERHEYLSSTDLGLERSARKGLERLKWEADRYEPFAHSVYDGPTPVVKAVLTPFRMPKKFDGETEISHILGGGDPFSPTVEVTPGVLSAAMTGTIPNSPSGRRLALAEWIVNPKNPLPTRVMVNRIWQWTMGQPLAGNPNNFGATGKKPTHPELLDWLAAEFVEGQWSVKKLQRTILLTDAYARSSRAADEKILAAKDPLGTSYATFKPRRLSAEELRDAMLAASGELTRTVGGIPIRPEIHSDVAFQPRQVMGTFAPAWEPSPKPEQRHRRTLYTLKLRGVRDPLLEVFNTPTPEFSCEARDVSTIAPQAFALFNSSATRDRALAFALKLLADKASRDETIAAAFRVAYGRTPTEGESKACLKHWDEMSARHRDIVIEKPQRPTEIKRVTVEENTGVKITFTEKLFSAVDFVSDRHPSDATPEERGLMEVCLVLFNANEFLYLD